jgi:hypothetical protein
MTFGIELCYIVTPLLRQRQITEQLIHHWQQGYGATYNPLRGEALKKVAIRNDLDEMLTEIRQDGEPIIIGTSSLEREQKAIGYDGLLRWIRREERPFLLLFGTGWGLTEETVGLCQKMLMPIKGAAEYNHLSLRVAVGIILDRIFGKRGGKDE